MATKPEAKVADRTVQQRVVEGRWAPSQFERVNPISEGNASSYDQRMELIRQALEGFNIQDYGAGQGNPDDAALQHQSTSNMRSSQGNQLGNTMLQSIINPDARQLPLEGAGEAMQETMRLLMEKFNLNSRPYQQLGEQYSVGGQNFWGAAATGQGNRERITANPDWYTPEQVSQAQNSMQMSSEQRRSASLAGISPSYAEMILRNPSGFEPDQVEAARQALYSWDTNRIGSGADRRPDVTYAGQGGIINNSQSVEQVLGMLDQRRDAGVGAYAVDPKIEQESIRMILENPQYYNQSQIAEARTGSLSWI